MILPFALGRTIIALLNVLKHCMSRSSVQELLKLLTSSLRSQGGHTQSLQTIVFDMLEVLLCMNVGDLVLDADIVRDLLHAMTQNKHRRLDVVVLALLSGRDKYGITCASDEILCPVHGTGHHPLHQRVVGSCDRCALTTLNSTLKAVLPAVEAKRLMCSDELLRSLRASAAPRSPFCVPVTMQKSIMEYCLESLDGVRAQIVSLLLQSSGAAYKLFKEEGWCERLCQAVRESEGDVCHGQLLVVESYLNLASHDLSMGVAGVSCVWEWLVCHVYGSGWCVMCMGVAGVSCVWEWLVCHVYGSGWCVMCMRLSLIF